MKETVTRLGEVLIMPQPQIETLEDRRLFSADLIGSFAGAIPATLPPGGANHVTVRVTNPTGQTEAARATVTLYLSDAPSLGDDALLLGTATRKIHLRGGQSTAFPFRFASPTSLPDETGYLLARIDGPTNADGSANETIALAPRAVSVVQPFVDLVGQIAQQPSTVFVSSASPGIAVARVKVFNSGNVTAHGALQITMYSSADSTLDSGDTVISVANFAGAAIRPGASRTFPVQLSLPAGTAVGSYTLLASINSSHTIAEINTDNNLAVGQHPFAVAAAPILVDLRDHHHQDNNDDNNQSVLLIDDGSTDVEYVYVDDSGSQDSAPAPSDGGDASTQPASQPVSNDQGGSTDSGGSTNSGDSSPGSSDSGSSDNGSDFSDPSPVDPNAGSDF
jgi:hypothetical protein